MVIHGYSCFLKQSRWGTWLLDYETRMTINGHEWVMNNNFNEYSWGFVDIRVFIR